MKPLIKMLIELGLIVSFLSMCTTYPTVTEEHKTWYSVNYNFDLTKVEKNGEVEKLDSVYSSSCIYEDTLIKIKWIISHNKLNFNLVNRSSSTLSINWDKIIFVDSKGTSHRVIHSGIKFNEKEKPQVPSNIIRKSTTNDILIPSDNIAFIPGFSSDFMDFSIPAHWAAKPFIDTCCDQNKQVTIEEANGNLGKVFQLLFSITIDKKDYEYIFSFISNSYDINDYCVKNRID